LGLPHRSQVAQKRATLPEWLQRREELQFPRIEGLLQIPQEQATEEMRKNPDGQEEPGPAGDPSSAVWREPTAGDDAMQVGMMQQILAPSVQHGEEANLRAQVFGIGGDGAQGLGRRTEENAVDRRLVLIGNGGNLFRYRKDDVKILRGEKLSTTVVQPLCAGERLTLRAVAIAATIEGDALVTALIALLDVTAECSGSAEFDRGHDATLCRA
jgi:hypothetical protein